MSITIRDMLKQKNCSSFRLASGEVGLDNRVETVGILDHEIINDSFHIFNQGDFVISNFTAARGDDELFRDSLIKLMSRNVSGIGIKDIYFNTLPHDVVRHSVKSGIPVFFFSEHIYFEDLISEIMNSVRDFDHQQLLQSKVHAILTGNFSRDTLKELALDLNPKFGGVIRCCSAHLKQPHRHKLIDDILKSRQSQSCSTINYNDGLLMIATGDTSAEALASMKSLLSSNRMSTDDFIMGFSCIHEGLHSIAEAIKESITTLKAAEVMGSSMKEYDDIGLYKLLIPAAKEDYSRKFAMGVIAPIRDYDTRYGTSLFDTAEVFVSCRGDYALTGEALFQHQNTIRFRIKKIREILGSEISQGEFFTMLSSAVKLKKLEEY